MSSLSLRERQTERDLINIYIISNYLAYKMSRSIFRFYPKVLLWKRYTVKVTLVTNAFTELHCVFILLMLVDSRKVSTTEYVTYLDLRTRWLFLSHFWPLLKRAMFFGAAGTEVEISLSLQSSNRNQVKIAQIREIHCRKTRQTHV